MCEEMLVVIFQNNNLFKSFLELKMDEMRSVNGDSALNLEISDLVSQLIYNSSFQITPYGHVIFER
jgi:hypothetical protein